MEYSTLQSINGVKIKSDINVYLQSLYNKLHLKDTFNFDLYKDINKEIFELYGDDNIDKYIEYYDETKPYIPFITWKDIIYLYKLEPENRNKYIYNLLDDDTKLLFQKSLSLSDGFKFVKLNSLVSSKEDLYNSLVNFNIKNMLQMILTLTGSHENVGSYIEQKLSEILENPSQLSDKFGLVLSEQYTNEQEQEQLLNTKIVNYYDINMNSAKINLKSYLYFIYLYLIILFGFGEKETNLATFLHNEKVGFASNINEYSYEDYIKLTTLLSDSFQDYIKDITELHILKQDGGNFDPNFVNLQNLPICFDETNLDYYQDNIDELLAKNMNFKVNNLWFNKFSKMPCKVPLPSIEPERTLFLFPNFIKSIVRRQVQYDGSTKIIDDERLLDLDNDVKNNYLQWYYRPTFLGVIKHGMRELIPDNNLNVITYYKDLDNNNLKHNPYYFTLYFNKLWIQLLCYQTAPNGFFNQIMPDELPLAKSNDTFFDMFKNHSVQLTHLFPFVFHIYTTQPRKSIQYNYDIIEFNIDNYYSIDKMKEYIYIGYILLPFDVDKSTKDTTRYVPRPDPKLYFYLFKHIKTGEIVISNHRNKVYSFFQRETSQLSIMELNIIGYLNRWDLEYNKWTLYPYFVIYTPKYKYYDKLPKRFVEPNNPNDPNKLLNQTHIYISTLKFDELTKHHENLNSRFYTNSTSEGARAEGASEKEESNTFINFQLTIPTTEEIMNSEYHMFMIPIIPVLANNDIKFICPYQTKYIIKDYPSLLKTKQEINQQMKGGNIQKFYNKYLKYKAKYINLKNKINYINIC
jgi:hypothetical protein